jgi:serine/threonine protein kinase
MKAGRRRIGDYYLTDLIGTGGMSKVYLALQVKTHEKRAVKILTKKATASALSYARFLREIEIIRGLSHPNIVKILESGALDDCYYYFMAYMPAGSLAQRLAQARISLADAMRIQRIICDAVAFAHARGIVHRDLKPANILLEDSGTPMVSDFGIAKILNSEARALTKSSEIIGSLAYLAPEQRFNAKSVDLRADVYSLGALFYEMIMGFPPLGNFPWPCETQKNFPHSIQAVIETCLKFNPQDRFADAGALLKELKRIAEEEQLQELSGSTSGSEHVQMQCQSSDSIEHLLELLRSGTAKVRLRVVKEMIGKLDRNTAAQLLELFPDESERVRWGLIIVLGELRVSQATPVIIGELKNPFLKEAAVEALGKIGSEEAFEPILHFLSDNPGNALSALIPLASTGKKRALDQLRKYLDHDMTVIRRQAVKALAVIGNAECRQIISHQLKLETDKTVRTALIEAIHDLEAKNLIQGEDDTITVSSVESLPA